MIAATRRKGKWAGGHPLLGYDIDVNGYKLVVNPSEAERVRAIFKLYVQHEALLPVVLELERRGWLNKRWTTRKGHERGGKPFDKTSLYKLLTNVAYIGKVRYKAEVHDGEHPAIVDPEVWRQVQCKLQRNGRTGGALVRNRFGAVLKGLIHCVPCGCAMTPTHSTRKGTIRYRYYVCSSAQKRGWHTCPSKSIPAAQIEQLVVNQIRSIGQDRALLQATILAVRARDETRLAELETERRHLDRELARWDAELRKMPPNPVDDPIIARMADLQERIRLAEDRVKRVRDEAAAIRRRRIDDEEVALALSAFDPVWESLTPAEQARVVHLLVERVDYDGAKGKVSITFRPSGIKALADELANERKEKIT